MKTRNVESCKEGFIVNKRKELNSVDLPTNHRHEEYDPLKPELVNAYDSIVIMKERAESIIYLVQTELVSDRTLNDSVLFTSLESARLELQDMMSIVEHFTDWQLQNKQAQKKPQIK